MPVRPEREYRRMQTFTRPENRAAQRFDSEYYVEGYATTFDQPYLLFEEPGIKLFETIDARAFDKADLSDVIFLHNHEGKCLARTKMKKGSAQTMIVEPDSHGLFTAADLGTIAEGRAEHEAILGGLIYEMSFAFTVGSDEFTDLGEGEYLRTIRQIRKVYDCSSVDRPANPFTYISARSTLEGFIERKRQELSERGKEAEARKRELEILKLLLEV